MNEVNKESNAQLAGCELPPRDCSPPHVTGEITTHKGRTATVTVAPDANPKTMDALKTLLDRAYEAAERGDFDNLENTKVFQEERSDELE